MKIASVLPREQSNEYIELTEWERVFANYASNRWFPPKIYKELKNLTTSHHKPQNHPKEGIQMTHKYRRHAEYPQPSGKYKFKPSWESTSLQEEWLKPSNTQMMLRIQGKCALLSTLLLHGVPQETKTKTTMWSSYSDSEASNRQGHSYMHVYCWTIPSCHDM